MCLHPEVCLVEVASVVGHSQGNVDVVDRTGHAGVEEPGLVYVESYGEGRERIGIKVSLCLGGERYVGPNVCKSAKLFW